MAGRVGGLEVKGGGCEGGNEGRCCGDDRNVMSVISGEETF